MDTDSFIVCIKAEDIYKDIVDDVETGFDTSNYELKCNSINKPLSKGKNEKVIRLMKCDLGGKSIKDKKAKVTKRRVIKREFKFENFKNCLEAT